MRSTLGLLVVGLGLLATGCPNPNLYGTPRTTPPGKISGFAALEGIGYVVKTKRVIEPNPYWNPDRRYQNILLQPPSFGGRVGVAERLDIGFRLTALSTLGADLKLNFLKTDPFDMAVDAGAEYALITATRVHLPLILGINFTDEVSLVLAPGAMYAVSNAPYDLDKVSTYRTITAAGGWYWRLGLGVSVRLSKKIGIQPEITFTKAFKQEQDPIFESLLLYSLGFGITFGSQPKYGPPDEPTTPPPPAPVVVAPSMPPAGHPPDSGAPPPSDSTAPPAPAGH